MALITINWNADMKSTAKALDRIAAVLERICTRYLLIDLVDSEEPVAKSPVEEVSYTTDRQELRKEIAEKLNIPLEDEPQDEAERSV